MKLWLSALFACLFLGQVDAQNHAHQETCALAFRVLDHSTEQGLPNASVWISNLNKQITTDSLGHFVLKGACLCVYHLHVHYVGYQPLETSFHVTQDTLIVLRLFEDRVQLEGVNIEDSHEPSHGMQTLHASSLQAQTLMQAKGSGLSKALEGISGVTTLSTGSQVAKPMIHGMHGNRILILNNGVKLQGQQWGQEHAPELDLFMAEDVSVVKGAASIKYGPEALGGVVLVNPAKLPHEGGIGGEWLAMMQSNGRGLATSGMLEGGIGHIHDLGWRVQGSFKRNGDLRSPHYFLTNTGAKELNFSASVGGITRGWALQAFYSHFQTEIGILKATSILGGLADLENAFAREIPALTEPHFSYKIGLPKQQVAHRLLKLQAEKEWHIGRWRWVYSWQQNLRQEFDRRMGDLLSQRPIIDLVVQTHQLDMNISHHAWRGISGEWGLSLAMQDNNNLPGTGRLPLIPNYNSYDAGIFAIERFNIKKTVLEAGIRFDTKLFSVRGRDFRNNLYADENLFKSVTASLGAQRSLGKNWELNTNIGLAWRAPNVAELYSFGRKQSVAAIEYGLLIGPNSEVLSFKEKEIANEQGLKWVATLEKRSERWFVELTGYANWIRNYVFLQPQGVTVLLNGPYPYYRYGQTDALFRGIDGAASFKPNDHWLLEAMGSAIWATNTRQNDRLPLIPANRASVSGSRLVKKLGKWSDLALKATVQGVTRASQAPKRVLSIPQLVNALEADEDLLANDKTLFDFMGPPKGYLLAGLSISAQRKLGKGMLHASVEGSNLLNTAYRSYTNRLRYFAEEPGRNVQLLLRFSF